MLAALFEPSQVYSRLMSNTNVTLCKFSFFQLKTHKTIATQGFKPYLIMLKKFKRLFELKCDHDPL